MVILERSAAYDLAEQLADSFVVVAETSEVATEYDRALGATISEKVSVATSDTQSLNDASYEVVVLIRRLANFLGSRDQPAVVRSSPSRRNYVDAIAMVLCSPPGSALSDALREQERAATTGHKEFFIFARKRWQNHFKKTSAPATRRAYQSLQDACTAFLEAS